MIGNKCIYTSIYFKTIAVGVSDTVKIASDDLQEKRREK